ncbi:hypothetical protein RRG08_037104 [Elysia crispata]|uniref:Uncharacterized protein n=1 Tax=Elysia crispata TaxID=231223 RepID=A0AAE0Y5G6_9GAST|nr:hypothetical protein RRG08_037104 [Elysia crispata]
MFTGPELCFCFHVLREFPVRTRDVFPEPAGRDLSTETARQSSLTATFAQNIKHLSDIINSSAAKQRSGTDDRITGDGVTAGLKIALRVLQVD